jgi:hypothetical protein
MIIGTRLEYCISDLLLKTESLEDVFVIVSDGLVNFSDSEQVEEWWSRQIDPMASHLSQGRNSLHLFELEEVHHYILALQDDGTIVTRHVLMPSKLINIMRADSKDHWYQVNLREKDMEPAVKMAWDHYRMLAGLCK